MLTSAVIWSTHETRLALLIVLNPTDRFVRSLAPEQFGDESYSCAVEYLARRPPELVATHRLHRSEPKYRKQLKLKAPKRKRKLDAVALAVLSIFLTKKEWREAKKVRIYVFRE